MTHAYGLIGPKGLAYIGLHDDEPDCWRTYLGCPLQEEIDDAKSRGWYCVQLTITWTTPPATKGKESDT